MSKSMLYTATALVLVAALVGCGGGQKPAPQKPPEPVFTAQVTNVDSVLVASIAKVGPYADAGKVITDLMTWITNAKITPAGGPFGVYMDDPTKVKPESTRYEVCIPVPAGTKPDKKAGVMVKKLAPVQMAVTDYTGPYDKVSDTYVQLFKWIGDNKYVPAGPMYEYYLSDPAKVPAESLKARVGVVVKPAPAPGDTTKPAAAPTKTATPAKTGGKPAKTGVKPAKTGQ